MNKLIFLLVFTIGSLFFCDSEINAQEIEHAHKNKIYYSYLATNNGVMAELRYERILDDQNALFVSFGKQIKQAIISRNIGYLRTVPLNHGFSFRFGVQYSVNSFRYFNIKTDYSRGYFHEIGIPMEIHFDVVNNFGLLFGFAPTFHLGSLEGNSSGESQFEKRYPNHPKYSIINNLRLGVYHSF